MNLSQQNNVTTQQRTKIKQRPVACRAFALSFTALTALALSSIATVSSAESPIPKLDSKPADMTKPVQVFILMGQSNMVGPHHTTN